MKTNITIKIIALVFCLLLYTSAIAAQERFSEYTTVPVNLDKLAEIADEFAARLAAEPLETQGYINLYDTTDEAAKIKSVLAKKSELKNRVIFFKPGIKYRFYSAAIEFWIVPPNTEPPFTPNCSLCECPIISVSGDKSATNRRAPLTFTANVSGGSGETVTYNWKVSAGEIVEGQSTPVIRVDAISAKEIIATVEIGGVCNECMREVSFTTEISRKPKLIDEFALEIFDISQGRLDNFIAVLTNNPTAQGYLINYAGRFENKRTFAKRIEQIKTYFKFRAEDTNVNPYYIDTSRLTFVNGGFREEAATELWLSFDDNQKPVPTPTIDKRFVKTSKPKSKPRK